MCSGKKSLRRGRAETGPDPAGHAHSKGNGSERRLHHQDPEVCRGDGTASVQGKTIIERTGEIGLLRALGACPGQVLTTGVGMAHALRLLAPGLPLRTPVSFIVGALVVSELVGLASGVLPALRASALDPVEALSAK